MMRLADGLRCRDVSRDRENRRTFLEDRSPYGCTDDSLSLSRIDDPGSVEGRGLEEVIGIHLLQRSGIDQATLDVTRDCDHGCSLFAGVHQPVEEMDNARSGCSADGDGQARE